LQLNDPKEICNNVSELGRWGNGEVEVGLSNGNEIDYVMELIQQAFDIQSEGE
jgi:predicted transport protein